MTNTTKYNSVRAEQSRAEQSRAEQSRAEQSSPIVRNSSLELLRIVGMVMIVACHTNHGGFNFPLNSITLNRLWQQFISMGGGLGNDIFVMLSGYFLITSKGLNLRRLFNLWVRIFFYSVLTYALFLFAGKTDFTLGVAVKVVMPITKSVWWFASTYFVLYLIHPYINILLNGFTHEEYKNFLLTIGLYWCIIPMFLYSYFGANSTINFICLYSLAGYIRLWCKDLAGRKYLLYALACIGLNFLSVIVLDVIGLKIPIVGKHALYFAEMMRPFTILAVVCLLVGFRSMNITYSKIINLLASATFGVYLIHDNNFVRHFLWYDLFHNASFQDSPYLIPYSTAVILAVYVVCTIIELLRSKIFRTLSGNRLS